MSEALSGWGEPIIEGRTTTVETSVGELGATYLLNRNSLSIEDIIEMPCTAAAFIVLVLLSCESQLKKSRLAS